MPKLTQQSGFTLIEALVSLLVFSVGLLGIAGLQIASLNSNTSSYRHSQATWLIYDMLDRMRANQSGDYDGFDTATAPSSLQDCTGLDCSVAEIANNDLFEWAAQLNILPAGRGQITQVGAQVTVTLMWDDLGTGATGTDCDPSQPNVDLFCISMTTEI